MVNCPHDAVANATTINGALDAVAEGGRVVVLGSPRQPITMDIYRKIHFKCAQLLGAHENARTLAIRQQAAPQVLAWLETGQIRTQPLITDHITLTDLPRMYEELRQHSDQHLGVIIHY